MNGVFSKKWWSAAAVRALKTFFQTLVATMGTATVISSVDWATTLSASATAAFLSIAMSIAGLPEVHADQADGDGEGHGQN